MPPKPALISQRRIQSAVKRLARQIDRACAASAIGELTVVCVMDGAFMFTADLVRALRTPTRIIFLKARSYQGTRKGATQVAVLPAELAGRALLLVDTIYDTGRTIERVVRQASRLAKSVWLAVLLEKHGQAAVPSDQQADRAFTGIKLAGDPFLVGYGLDVDGQFRGLPDVWIYNAASRRAGRRARKR